MIDTRNDFTRRFFLECGIAPDMHILDIGCGTGEVSFLLSDLLAETGHITGIDLNDQALAIARKKSKEEQRSNLTFLHQDLKDISQLPDKFDTIVGRRVLMYLPHPEKTIQALKTCLKPGGRMIFQESDAFGADTAQESLPLHTQVQKWIWDTVAKEGGNPHIGSNLYQLFTKAGFEVLTYKGEALIQTAKTGSDLAWLAQVMEAHILQHQIATKAQLDLPNLAKKLQAEMANSQTSLIHDMNFGICAVK